LLRCLIIVHCKHHAKIEPQEIKGAQSSRY
jgi:hypothetical protein